MPNCSVRSCSCRLRKGHISVNILDEWKPILTETYGENGMKNWQRICECHFGDDMFVHIRKLRSDAIPCSAPNYSSQKRSDFSIKKELNDMKSKYEKLFSELNELKSRISMIFNEDQIESVFKKVVWSETTISESLALRFKIGKLSYDYLRSKGFPLPSYRLICRRSLEETKDQFKCKICHKSFSTQKLLKSHKNSSHPNRDQNSVESDSEEDKTLEDSSVSVNQNIESRENSYFCSFSGCDERFLIINELKTHLNKVHEKEKLIESKKILKPNKTLLKCNSCQFTTHLNYKLKRHNASFHSNERPFKCPANGCQLRFKLKDHLTQHQFRVHSTERPHRCLWPECGASFKTKCLLRIHRRRHTGEKPFVCDWPECSAKFYTNCVLKAHQLNHTKPFKCQFIGCDKAFGAKREMNKHFETQHKK